MRATLSFQTVGKSGFNMHVFKICVKGVLNGLKLA